jgi:hypothetical protein
LLIFWTEVSCFSVTLFNSTLFCCGGKANLVRFTLFYSTLLTLTHRQKDRRINEYTRFAWAGGTCPCFAWPGGTFFPVVLLCQFLVLVGNRFWFYILLCTWCTIQLWCCVSFFVSGGKKLLVLCTYLVYNLVVRLCHFCCCGGKVNFVQIPYSHDHFSKISRTFSVKKLIPYKTYVREDQLFLALYESTIIQTRLFLKNIENFV